MDKKSIHASMSIHATLLKHQRTRTHFFYIHHKIKTWRHLDWLGFFSVMEEILKLSKIGE